MNKAEWYTLDEFNKPQGPYSLRAIHAVMQRSDFYVWKKGMSDWAMASSVISPPQSNSFDPNDDPTICAINSQRVATRSLDEFIGLCKGLIADGEISDPEIHLLKNWLKANPSLSKEWPGTEIASRLKAISKGGIIDKKTRSELVEIISKMVGAPGTANQSTRLPLDDPPPQISFPGKCFCFTGKFIYGTRTKCQSCVINLGSSFRQDPTFDVDFLVIGALSNQNWIHSTHGRKIERALEIRTSRNGHIAIVSEEHWSSFL